MVHFLRYFLKLAIPLACFSVFFSAYAQAQKVIRGRVADAMTGEPISFVTVRYGANFMEGVVTNLEGEFEVKTDARELLFTYIGYEQVKVKMDTVKKLPLLIPMQPQGVTLGEVLILGSTENPAHRIIRAVVANEKQNNPNNYEAYKATIYNKIVYDFIYHDMDSTRPELHLLGKDIDIKLRRLPADSLQARWERRLKGGHSLMMESVTERMRQNPGKERDHVIGTKISGFKRPEYSPLATLVQPFTFYGDIIELMDVSYLSPISNGSWRKYFFHIEDTLLTGDAILPLPGQTVRPGDTVFVISFQPEKGSTFPGLIGTLWINTHGYAIQNVIAEPALQVGAECRVRQAYSMVSGDYWFPSELDFEVVLPEYPSKKMGLQAVGRSYINAVDLSPNFTPQDFGAESLTKSDSATMQDTAFWTHHRVEALTQREQITYRVLDSVGEVKKFDKRFALAQKVVVFGRLEAGKFDFNLERVFSRNLHEGARLGIGIHTNEKLSTKWRVGGFVGYGLEDSRWKYGGDFRWTFNKEREAFLQVAASHEIVESGKLDAYGVPQVFSTRNFRKFRRVDQYDGVTVSHEARVLKYLKYNVGLSYYRKSPAGYEYGYRLDGGGYQTGNFTFADIRIGVRYSFREKLMDINGMRLSIGTPYPVANLTYTRSIPGFMGSQFNYQKLEGNLSYSFAYKSIGNTAIRVEGGYTWGNVPIMNAFAGNGIYTTQASFRVTNTFSTMRFFEFASDRYIDVFFTHSFSTPFYKTKYSKPRLMLAQNYGIGSMPSPSMHQMTTSYKTMEKGFIESGAYLNDLVRFTYLSFLAVGVGGGAYRRYGAYAFANEADNWAIVFTLNFTTN